MVPTDFEILSEKICALFSTESPSTYYIPRVPGTSKLKPINAKGKLIDRYRNVRKFYNLPSTQVVNEEQPQSTLDTNNIGKDYIIPY